MRTALLFAVCVHVGVVVGNARANTNHVLKAIDSQGRHLQGHTNQFVKLVDGDDNNKQSHVKLEYDLELADNVVNLDYIDGIVGVSCSPDSANLFVHATHVSAFEKLKAGDSLFSTRFEMSECGLQSSASSSVISKSGTVRGNQVVRMKAASRPIVSKTMQVPVLEKLDSDTQRSFVTAILSLAGARDKQLEDEVDNSFAYKVFKAGYLSMEIVSDEEIVVPLELDVDQLKTHNQLAENVVVFPSTDKTNSLNHLQKQSSSPHKSNECDPTQTFCFTSPLYMDSFQPGDTIPISWTSTYSGSVRLCVSQDIPSGTTLLGCMSLSESGLNTASFYIDPLISQKFYPFCITIQSTNCDLGCVLDAQSERFLINLVHYSTAIGFLGPNTLPTVNVTCHHLCRPNVTLLNSDSPICKVCEPANPELSLIYFDLKNSTFHHSARFTKVYLTASGHFDFEISGDFSLDFQLLGELFLAYVDKLEFRAVEISFPLIGSLLTSDFTFTPTLKLDVAIMGSLTASGLVTGNFSGRINNTHSSFDKSTNTSGVHVDLEAMGTAGFQFGIHTNVVLSLSGITTASIQFEPFWRLDTEIAFPAVVFQDCSTTRRSHIKAIYYIGIDDIQMETHAGVLLGRMVFPFTPREWAFPARCFFYDHSSTNTLAKRFILLSLNTSAIADASQLTEVQFGVALAFRSNMDNILAQDTFVLPSTSDMIFGKRKSSDTYIQLYVVFTSDAAYEQAASSRVMNQVRNSRYFSGFVGETTFESSESEPTNTLPAAAIAGAVIGAVVGLTVLVVGAALLYRHHKQTQCDSVNNDQQHASKSKSKAAHAQAVQVEETNFPLTKTTTAEVAVVDYPPLT